ncbi:MAG: hypothetical protein JKY37_13990 [Nannocystaceae bacterium]|nr:hypothetical protein [Nannocystaceae bacterium]
MDQAIKNRIASNFNANITRVRSLIAVYDALGTAGPGRPSGQQTDVLRAGVVLLHASLEDLIRSSSEALLPSASRDVLNEIGFPDGPDQTKTKFTLGELHAYKGQTIDELIRAAVHARLQRSNYGSVAEVAAALERIGVDRVVLDPDQPILEPIMKRRHLIVHRADKNPVSTRGRGILLTVHLPKETVSSWVGTVERVGARILGALPLGH